MLVNPYSNTFMSGEVTTLTPLINSPFYGINRMYLIISLAVWSAFLVAAWLTFGYPKDINEIWLTFASKDPEPQTFIDLYYVLHKICFLITYLIATASFCYFFLNIIGKAPAIFEWLVIGNTRYHIVPLLCVTALFILGEVCGDKVGGGGSDEPSPSPSDETQVNEGDEGGDGGDGDDVNLEQDEPGDTSDVSPSDGGDADIDVIYIFDFIFTAIALSSLLYIYSITLAYENFLFNLLIRKGTYSCLITLLIYNIFYIINFYTKAKITDDGDKDSFNTGCGYAFTILIGLIILPLATYARDYLMSAMGFFVEIGIAVTCLKVSSEPHYGGYIAIAMAVFSLIQILYLVVRERGAVYYYTAATYI